MTYDNDIPGLISLAHSSKLRIEVINELLAKIIHDKRSTVEEFFRLPEKHLTEEYALSGKVIDGIKAAHAEIPNNSFLAETLLAQGFDVIPIYSPEYSPTLKANLKAKASPPVLYVKGNKKILHEESIAIVGSRDASEVALRFTDNIARIASAQYKVIVSGFAKGVDKQALDSALKYVGHSIIVLPQGILTFESGIKKYYEQIVAGDALVLSTFFPKAPWSVQLAMGRNPYIYGLAEKIFVAESGPEGGTWAGVIDGLRKGRTIFVRMPQPEEKNANVQLIERGAVPVDFDGIPLIVEESVVMENTALFTPSLSQDAANEMKPSSQQKRRQKRKKSESQSELDLFT